MSGTELIARLEAAECGSRELDALIWAHLRPERIKVTGWNQPYGDGSGRTQVEFQLLPKRTRTVTADRGDYQHAEPVTTSLDAALALAERVLPGCDICLCRSDGSWEADCEPRGFAPDARFVDHRGATPALALCVAILKALAATPSDTAGRNEGRQPEVTPSKEPIHE